MSGVAELTGHEQNARDARACRPRRRSSGFTLLELMIVMAIILILATLGAGRYEQSLMRAHEAALKHDLFVMRNAIQQYTLDKEAGPTSLDDLVRAGYLREIPRDPHHPAERLGHIERRSAGQPGSDHNRNHRRAFRLGRDIFV